MSHFWWAHNLLWIILYALITGLLVTASPWILLALLCTITSISVYYLTLSHDDDDDDSVYDIRVSLCALSLDHDKQHSSNHSNTSWFSELNKLDLLNVGSPLPVTMDTANRQIISPPKLKLHKTFSSHSNHWSNGLRENNYTTINHKQYYIIILSCLLSVSIMCNVVLIYWIT